MPHRLLPKWLRQWLRISVRGLIVLVLIIGAGLGWIVHGVRSQREAVAAIRRDGGAVLYDWEWKDQFYQSDLRGTQVSRAGVSELRLVLPRIVGVKLVRENRAPPVVQPEKTSPGGDADP